MQNFVAVYCRKFLLEESTMQFYVIFIFIFIILSLILNTFILSEGRNRKIWFSCSS